MKIGLLSAGFEGISVSNYTLEQIVIHKHAAIAKENPDKSLLNFKIFLADLDRLNYQDAVDLHGLRGEIRDLFLGGAAIVVIAGEQWASMPHGRADRYRWIPGIDGEMGYREMPSRECTVNSDLVSQFEGRVGHAKPELFDGIKKLLYPKGYFDTKIHENVISNASFISGVLLANSAGKPVGYLIYARANSGLILILPRYTQPEKGIRELFSSVIPYFCPHLRAQPLYEKPPEWIAGEKQKIPGILDLMKQAEIEKAEISALEERIVASKIKIRELAEWLKLIYSTDKPFELIALKALDCLLSLKGKGVHEPKRDNGPDIAFDFAGEKYIVECGGTEGVFPKAKGDQLLGWLADPDYSESHNGILLVNPLRQLPIAEREKLFLEKPENLFSDHLLRAATKRGFSIIWSADLYRLIVDILSGNQPNIERIESALKTPGLQRLK